LLAIPDNYRVLFLQGGALLQFGMIPMNFLRKTGRSADYIVTGTWSKKAVDEAKTQGTTSVAWDGKAGNYNRVPRQDELKLDPKAAYVYIARNETIQGVQYPCEPETGDVPLVADASSEILSRPVPIRKYGILFACAQKNAGPAGVTIVIIRDDLAAQSAKDLPSMFNYQALAENKSMLNTPPVFGVYMVKLVPTGSLREVRLRGCDAGDQPAEGADALRGHRRRGGFYQAHAEPGSRSMMNVPFRLADPALEEPFLKESAACGLHELKGAPLGGRLPGLDLQCHARRRRHGPAGFHGRVREEARVMSGRKRATD